MRLVDFYYLTNAPLERVLPAVCEKLLARGERMLVVAEPAAMEQIDRILWTYAPDSFLPHAAAGQAADADQPILLTSQTENSNGARNLALADGRWREQALGFDRTFYFFDSAHRDDAREAWRALKDREGVERRYWKQDERGRWVQGP